MQLSLRAGEKLYLNGAVIKVDRKVSIELMNDVTFLLEAHVMTPEQTTTPLRQLYFTIQVLLMDPSCEAGPQADTMLSRLLDTFENQEIKAGLRQVRELLAARRRFEALKTIRRLFAIEADIFAPAPPRIALSA
jgi:flagellar biosynthesis repressor protein FlbT